MAISFTAFDDNLLKQVLLTKEQTSQILTWIRQQQNSSSSSSSINVDDLPVNLHLEEVEDLNLLENYLKPKEPLLRFVSTIKLL